MPLSPVQEALAQLIALPSSDEAKPEDTESLVQKHSKAPGKDWSCPFKRSCCCMAFG